MNIQLCIHNRIIAEGIKRVTQEKLPESIVGDHYFGSALIDPDIVIFSFREQMPSLKELYPCSRFICCDLGLTDSDIACLLYCHGVLGIISCNLGVENFAKALNTVCDGDIWLEQSHLHVLLQHEKILPLYKKYDR